MNYHLNFQGPNPGGEDQERVMRTTLEKIAWGHWVFHRAAMKTAGYFWYFEMGTLLNNDLIQDYLSRVEVIPENLSNNLKVAFKPS